MLRKSLLFVLQFVFSAAVLAQPIDSISTPDQRTVVIKSAALKENRSVWVHLPAEYKTGTDSYPVLYLLDGGSHFAYTCGMVDFLSGFEANQLPRMIIVGIPNIDRQRDFSPEFKDRQPLGKGASTFLEFIRDELIPYIDKNFRTQPYRILEGHSLAGLFALYAQEYAVDLFQASILISPAITNKPGEILLANLPAHLKANQDIDHRMFVTIGAESLDGFNGLTKHLKQSASKKFRWVAAKYEREDHFSIPLISIYDGLRFIYSKWHLGIFLNAQPVSFAQVNQHFENLSKEFGYTIRPTEEFLNQCGYQRLRNGHFTEAVEFFEENIRAHPDSYNVYDSMGEAYLIKGQKDLAIQYYEKSVAINPDHEHGKMMLRQLKNGQ
jgi:predicted alpha/beta superfamily hydrolase